MTLTEAFMPLRTRLELIICMLSLLLIAACGGSVAAAPALKTSSPTSSITVSASPSPTTIGLSQTAKITATVQNDRQAAGVTWSIGSAPGSIQASDALNAVYTAPAQLSASSPITITATSVADPSQSARATVTVNPGVALTSLTCDTTGALGPLQASELTATAINDGNAGVTWTLSAGAPGTLTQEDPYHAAYTAPVSIASAAAVTITAASKADPTQTQSISLNLSPTLTLPGSVTPPPYWMNLVQYQNGIDRAAAAPPCLLPNSSPAVSLPCKPYALLATPGTSLNPQWQPNILIFRDPQTNSEIWRLSNDPSDTSIPGIVNRTPWNANGSYFILNSTRNPTQSQYGNAGDWLYDARGGLQSEILPFDPNRQPSWTQGIASGSIYLPPDRIDPNLVYLVDWADNNQNTWPASHAFLYAVNLAPNAQGKRFQATAVADLPNSTDPVTGIQSVTVRKEIRGQLADDDHILINDTNPGAVPAANDPGGYPMLYLYDGSSVDTVVAANAAADPQHLPSQLAPLQAPFSIHFGLSLPQFDPCPAGASGLGNSASPCHSVGDEWHVHDIGITRNAPDTVGMNYGPRSDVGEYVDFSVPTPFLGDITTVSTIYPKVFPNGNAPYMSHPGISDDGSEASYEGESIQGMNDFGIWLRNLNTNTPIRKFEPSPVGAGHNDWSGYDPNYLVFDAACVAASGCPTYQGPVYNLYEGLANPASTFPSTGRGDRILAHYPVTNQSGIYSPTQSPDATKVMITLGDGLDPSSVSRLTSYVVVSHRPFPPTLAITSTSPVTLTWTPYTPHREVAGYHVYRSPAAGSPAFADISGLVTGTTYTDSSAVAGTSYLYAVTAEEYSGLESDQLSNVMQIAGGVASPAAGIPTTGWDTSAPAAPTQPTVTQLTDPTGKIPDIWQVSWTPSSSTNVRYYNVYVSFGAAPQTTAAYRVDSPPLGQTSYIYWQGDPNVKPVFGITAVDRQDNESSMACVAAIATSQACAGH